MPGPSQEQQVESLTIRASGPATQDGRLSLSELARIASGFQATLERIAYSIVAGRKCPGRFPREIADAVRMDFVGFRRGSVVLGLQRPEIETPDDLLTDSFNTLVGGLHSLRRSPVELPEFFNPAIINGLVVLCGGISERNVDRIEFFTEGHTYFTLDAEMRYVLRQAQRNSSQQELTIVGWLHVSSRKSCGQAW